MSFRSRNRGVLRAGRGLVGSTIAFDPLSIAGLAAWWDASDTTTITHSSNNVTQLRDKSGNVRHLNGTGSTTNTRTLNGRNTLDFDGIDDRLSTSSFWYAAGDSTAFIVFQLDADPNPAGGLGNGGLMYEWAGGASQWAQLYGIRSENSTNVPPNGGYSYFTRSDANSVRFDIKGDDPTNGQANVLWARDTTTLAETQLNNGTIKSASYTRTSAGLGTFGLFYTDGPENGYTYRGNDGRFAEALIYDSALSDPNLNAVKAYLRTKWGI